MTTLHYFDGRRCRDCDTADASEIGKRFCALAETTLQGILRAGPQLDARVNGPVVLTAAAAELARRRRLAKEFDRAVDTAARARLARQNWSLERLRIGAIS